MSEQKIERASVPPPAPGAGEPQRFLEAELGDLRDPETLRERFRQVFYPHLSQGTFAAHFADLTLPAWDEVRLEFAGVQALVNDVFKLAASSGGAAPRGLVEKWRREADQIRDTGEDALEHPISSQQIISLRTHANELEAALAGSAPGDVEARSCGELRNAVLDLLLKALQPECRRQAARCREARRGARCYGELSAAASPSRDVEGYGNARCVCGHLSSRHACDHATSDDSCFDCGCEAFAAARPSGDPPRPRSS